MGDINVGSKTAVHSLHGHGHSTVFWVYGYWHPTNFVNWKYCCNILTWKLTLKKPLQCTWMSHLEDHVVILILLLQYFSPPCLTQLQLQDKSGIVNKKILTMKVLVVLLGLITATFLSGKED